MRLHPDEAASRHVSNTGKQRKNRIRNVYQISSPRIEQPRINIDFENLENFRGRKEVTRERKELTLNKNFFSFDYSRISLRGYACRFRRNSKERKETKETRLHSINDTSLIPRLLPAITRMWLLSVTCISLWDSRTGNAGRRNEMQRSE